jgi:hypothetical protein
LDVIYKNNVNIDTTAISMTTYMTERTSQDEELTYTFLQKAHIPICSILPVLLRQLILLDTWDREHIILLKHGDSSTAIPHL